ncbi:hypothetical protein [Lentibacillus jeotgali]|uniref:hypothetical protein n=1 Tax=Lentibacillus jeotgali TaxID=558169 RepID=UPI00031EB63E|nr:hypothetical protein [Lentibacillus jeotgali]
MKSSENKNEKAMEEKMDEVPAPALKMIFVLLLVSGVGILYLLFWELILTL